MAAVPRVKFLNGLEIPQLGLGTWKSVKGEVTEAVKTAISCGYRHIDTAAAYGNEAEVGTGIKAKIDDGTVKREDLFICTKVWNNSHSLAAAKKACGESLGKLGLDYVDLYLVHWPQGYVENREMFPKDDNGKFIYSDVDYVETWKALEELVDEGKCKSIGLSNFNSQQIQRVWDMARVKPANLQIELHPYLCQEKLVNFCKEKGITVTAYSPLGSPDRPWAKEGEPILLEDPKVTSIADRLGKTPAQVVLHWAIQRGIIVIPKSVTASRIESNFELFDFSLTDDDVTHLNSFDGEHHRGCKLEWVSDHPHWPFSVPF